MSEETTTSPASTQPELITPEPTELIPSSPMKLFAHLKAYPVISQTRHLVLQVPFTKTAIDTVSTPLKTVSEIQPLKAVLDKSDTAVNSMLTTLDTTFPSLKHIEIHDFTDPITRPLNGTAVSINTGIKLANEQVSQNIITPTAKAALNAKDNFTTMVHDNNGKGIITSQVDFLIAPINNKLEQLINSYLPATKKVSKNHSSEVSRSVRIVKNVIMGTHEKLVTTPGEQVTGEETEIATNTV